MSKSPLLERRSPVGISYAMLILAVFFLLIPAAFRGARLSLGKKENDVKDWLPASFAETAELEWFADHFVGESFVLATWDGCTAEDQSLKLLTEKLVHESAQYDPATEHSEQTVATIRRAKAIGVELGLVQAGRDQHGWGGKNEKWFRSSSGVWFYLTPQSELYRWDEPANGPAALVREIKRASGTFKLDGTFITGFGPSQVIYNDPSLMCAPLFETIQTGHTIVAELAKEGGPLWPVDLTDPDRRAIVAKRRAMERLTGMLFAPAVPEGFGWTAAEFREATPAKRRDQLPADFDELVDARVARAVKDDYRGSLENLRAASMAAQTQTWYAVWDSVQVDAPPRLTCVLATLSPTAKDQLGYAIGRGVMGQPRGRLLTLAEDSGLFAALPPSVAPPPLNRNPPIEAPGKPALRLGGPVVDNMSIDEEGTITLVRLVGYSMVLGIILSYLCFRSIKTTIMIFVVGGSSAIVSVAMVHWTGGKVDAILMSMPSLVYVLGLSGAIHVVNYYRDEVRARGQVGAAGRALRHALLPCTLASFTTAIGLISLYSSNLAPISNFGLYSAIGVMSTLGVLFSYLPASLQAFAPSAGETSPADDTADPSQPAKRPEPQIESKFSQWWAGVGRTIAHHHAAFSIGCVVFLAACTWGMTDIRTSVQLLELFDSNARIIRDYAWMEDNFGKLVPMEVVVRMPPSLQADSTLKSDAADKLELIERVEAVSRIRKVVQRTLGEPGLGVVGQATGSDTFLPNLPAPSNGYNPVRSKYNRELLASQDELRDNDYLKIEKFGPMEGSELWRISLRVAALSDVDYGQFISTVRESVVPVLRAYETREQVVGALAANDRSGKAKRAASVMVVGAKRPDSLDETALVSADKQEILARNTYLATLGELLSAEQIKEPRWLSLEPEKARQLVDSERWEKLLANFDAVVWVGGDSFREADFASASHLIDARGAESEPLDPILLPGRIPSVQGGGKMQAIYTGVIPVVYKAQRTLLVSLADSIGLAFVLIAVVMIVLLNPGVGLLMKTHPRNLFYGLAAGMVAMIPNVFPVLMVFGILCHLKIEIDIGTMMTASVAMGVAVDDTIHFLSWFRENLDRGKSRIEAVIETYRRVGPAMTQTTVVGGLGLFVFSLSTFTPTQRFGSLMLVMLFAALIGDLILLPALLAGPLGRFFKPRLDAQGKPIAAGEPTVIEQQPVADPIFHADAEPSPASSAMFSDASEAGNEESETEERPLLKVHFPQTRTDQPHRIKRR